MRAYLLAGSLMLSQPSVSTPCEKLNDAVDQNHIVGLAQMAQDCVRSGENLAWTAMHHAALRDARLLVRILANNGIPINARDGNYYTPLFVAHAKGHIAMARLLESLGGHL